MRLLSNGELYFSSPDKLNDPLDCGFYPGAVQSELEQVADSAVRDKLREILSSPLNDKVMSNTSSILEAIETRVNKAGVLSFSLTPTETLMWSHYAGGHSGICVGIETEWFENFIEKEWESNKLIGGKSVLYKEKPDFHEILLKSYAKKVDDGKKINIDHLFIDIVIPVLITKSIHWEYEQEYRVIRRESGVVRIPGEAIAEVIVGKKIPDGDYALLQAILSKPSLSHVRLGRADFGENSFDMNISYV